MNFVYLTLYICWILLNDFDCISANKDVNVSCFTANLTNFTSSEHVGRYYYILKETSENYTEIILSSEEDRYYHTICLKVISILHSFAAAVLMEYFSEDDYSLSIILAIYSVFSVVENLFIGYSFAISEAQIYFGIYIVALVLLAVIFAVLTIGKWFYRTYTFQWRVILAISGLILTSTIVVWWNYLLIVEFPEKTRAFNCVEALADSVEDIVLTSIFVIYRKRQGVKDYLSTIPPFHFLIVPSIPRANAGKDVLINVYRCSRGSDDGEVSFYENDRTKKAKIVFQFSEIPVIFPIKPEMKLVTSEKCGKLSLIHGNINYQFQTENADRDSFCLLWKYLYEKCNRTGELRTS